MKYQIGAVYKPGRIGDTHSNLMPGWYPKLSWNDGDYEFLDLGPHGTVEGALNEARRQQQKWEVRLGTTDECA